MKKSYSEYMKIFLELGKVKITFFVAVSTSVGYVLFKNEIDWLIVLVGLGVFLLAISSSTINHFQERDTDSLMERTKGRPIPAGKIQPGSAITFAFIVGLIGISIIFYTGGLSGFILGVLAFIWYNLIYTPLKKKYALAVVPGSVIGAIPPMIGWVSAGGGIFDPQILAFSMFFFIWQIPHFWLLLLLHGQDYARAGFPVLTDVFTESQLSRITFMWIAALSVSCLLIPLFSITKNYYTVGLLIVSCIWLLVRAKDILSPIIERKMFLKAFLNVNLFVLAVVTILSIDKLLL